ncbi:hypothetical protein OQH60_03760 [Campylobacter sp. MIT 21-1685]|uniref:hypothetical protein n=1 Tax=unclassified Campylobacter TaxID=2593542 RepID=UPI00224A7224|nr:MULTISPECIES: hypothetical protein [unclassified Campylobacter]MCX2682977.1 hypothetical protein [Campylobacter sp. MIT 21-1684]MCX2751259.1 hypothetical protein [Campylobacter sp. MIT 21-1682]MCX2807458.1 hypothetical protein [Campylobacter sp. MIT 21-1685]
MKQYLSIGILIVLLLVLCVVVFLLLWNFRTNPDFTSNLTAKIINEYNNINQNKIVEKTWQEKLIELPQRNFTPAAEQFMLHFDIDTSELTEKTKYYQLIVNKYDIYSLFCLKQVLNSFEVKYFLLKSRESPEIFIDLDSTPEIFINTENRNLIEEIIEELKKYKINAKAKEIWL